MALLATHPYVTIAAGQADAAAGCLVGYYCLHSGLLQQGVPINLHTSNAADSVPAYCASPCTTGLLHCSEPLLVSCCCCLAAVFVGVCLRLSRAGRHVGDHSLCHLCHSVCALVPQHVQSRKAQPQALGVTACMRAFPVAHSQLTAIMTLCCDTLQIWSWDLWFVGGVDIHQPRTTQLTLCVTPAGYNVAGSSSSDVLTTARA